MLIKIVLLPFTFVKNIIGFIIGIIRLILGVIFGLGRFVAHRILGTAFGAIIGFFLGSGHIRMRMPWSRRRR